MAKKTKTPTKKGNNSKGIIGGMTSLLGNSFGGLQDMVKPSFTTDSSGGKSTPGSFVEAVDRPPDQVRRGVEGVKSSPTTYSQFTSKGNHIHTGDPFHADYDKGYEARYAIEANYTALNGRHNALLSFADSGGYGIPLFVHTVETGFAVSGESHQSQKGSVYYPRNFTQTNLKLACQAPNPFYYGKVMEAIRDSQMPFAKVSRLEIWQPTDRDHTIRGKFERIDCDGYVTMATRKHERHTFSPDFDITFTVVVFRSPTAWADTIGTYTMQSDWHLMITPDPKKGKGFVFEEAPEVYKTAEEQRTAANKAAKDSNKQGAKNAAAAAAEAQAVADKGNKNR